jgi:autotransporter-associated beta strand protein
VSSGNLTISNASALGGIGTGTTVVNGAALRIQGDIAVGAEALNISGSGVSNAGALRNLSGANSLSGAIMLSGATIIGSDAGALTLSGGISGTQNLTLAGAGNTTISGAIATSTGTLTKNGSGTATLSAANTYSGSTTVNAGTLNAAAANALGNSSAINVNGGSFLVTASNAVNNDAAINLNGGTLAIGGGAGEVVGALTLSANSTIDMNGVGNTWISFASLTSVLDNSRRLEVWNYTPSSDAIYFQDQTNLASSLNYISFYSGAGTGTFYNAFNTSSFSAPELYATVVPEPSTYIAAALLLGGLCVQYLRRTRYKAESGRS